MYETRENNARILSKFVPYKFYKQNTEKNRSGKKREKRKAKFAPLVYRRTSPDLHGLASGSAFDGLCRGGALLGSRRVRGGFAGFAGTLLDGCWMLPKGKRTMFGER